MKADYVLAVHRGLIVGAYKADHWLRATPENFPGMPAHKDRWGFVGREAPEDIQKLYLRKRLPDDMRAKGSQNPIRYVMARVTSTVGGAPA